MNLLSKTILYGFFLLMLAASCNSTYSPRPKGYFAISFPEKKYRLFDQPGYPYAFEYPEYANVIKDSTYFEGKPENDWWINVDFPQFNGKIYISYKEIGPNKFEKLKEDAYKLTYKHTSKAYNIEDSLFTNPHGVYGVFFKVDGNVATAKQFFMTDTTKHFLRGALYFDATPNEDSLGIVYQFLQEDMKHLINSFRWKK
jgi:gliding motility-associated lipoprotein GldD